MDRKKYGINNFIKNLFCFVDQTSSNFENRKISTIQSYQSVFLQKMALNDPYQIHQKCYILDFMWYFQPFIFCPQKKPNL